MSNCRKNSRQRLVIRKQPNSLFDHLLKVVHRSRAQRKIAQLIALFSSDQEKFIDFESNPPDPAPAPAQGCWPNTASKKKRIQLKRQEQYDTLKRVFTRDGYNIDNGYHMTRSIAEKRMQHLVDRKLALQELYKEQEPGFRRYLLEDDVIPDLIQAYDRRILEMSWRIAGPEGREEFLLDFFDDPQYKFQLLEHRKALDEIILDSLANTCPEDRCRRSRQLKKLRARVTHLQPSLDPETNKNQACPIIAHIDMILLQHDSSPQRSAGRLATGHPTGSREPSTPGAMWARSGTSGANCGNDGEEDCSN